MNSEYRSGSYYSYDSRSPYFKLNNKSSKPQNKYQKAASGLTGLLILIVIATIVCAIIAGVNNSSLNIMQAEYSNYMNMITRARENTDYQATATIVGRFYDPDSDKYYLEYEVPINIFNYHTETTPALYSFEQLEYYPVGGSIQVALSDKLENISMFTDSVVMELDGYMIESLGDYSSTKNTFTITENLAIIFGTIDIVLVAIVIILYSVGGKKSATSTNKSNGTNTADTPINKGNCCEYCGGNLDGSQGKCPNCGASIRRQNR